MFTDLNEERIKLIPNYINSYYSKVLNKNNTDINIQKTEEWFKWLYKICELKEPKIHIVSSPVEAQKLANKLSKTKDVIYPYSNYGNVCDIGWVAFYRFFKEVCGVEYNDLDIFNKYSEFSETYVYDSIQFDKHCIVIKLPEFIKISNDRLHSPDSPAVRFEDGCELYFWMNIKVERKYIMEPETVTSKDIISETNVEKRRAYREILGASKYYNILSNGNGLKIIDEDIDEQGNPMKLFETKIQDDLINKKVQFIEVICPSTNRMYNIYPPNQKSKNVWEAKTSTFNNKKLTYRHGDVGLKLINKDYDNPLIET